MNPTKVLEEKNALLGPGLATNYWFGYLKWICAARDGDDDDDEEGDNDVGDVGDEDGDEEESWSLKYLFCLKNYWNSPHLEMQVTLKVRLVKLN